MDSEDITYAGDSIKSTKRTHQKTNTSVYSKRQILSSKPRNLSQPIDSTSTLIDNPNISSSLNNYKLKLSLKSIYDSDPAKKLEEIFSTKYKKSPRLFKREKNRPVLSSIRKKRGLVDSMFKEKEAELIRDELTYIKSPTV